MKKIILTIAAIGALTATAQNPTWLWAKNAGGASDEAGWAVASDASGNVYAAGSFKSPTILFGATTLTNTGSGTADIFLVKYDGSGNVTWAKNFGTTSDDEALAIATDASGNVFIGGYFNTSSISIGSSTIANNGGDDYFVAKTDANGAVLWAKGAGGNGTERISAMCTDQAGNINAIGMSYSSFINGTVSINNVGDWDVIFAQYSPSGNLLSASGFGSTGRDDANSITYCSTNGFLYAAGSFDGPSMSLPNNTVTNVNPGTKDAFLLEGNGNSLNWAGSFGGSGDDVIAAVNAGTGGSSMICLAGAFTSTQLVIGSSTLTNAGGADIFIAQYNSGNNTPVWASRAGGPADDFAFRLSVDNSNKAYVSGYFTSQNLSIGTNTFTNAGSGTADFFVGSFDSSGNWLWSKAAGGTSNDYCVSICTDASANVYISGWYGSPSLTLGSLSPLNNAGGNDAYIAKIGNTQVTGIKNESATDKLLLYPNPSAGRFTVSGVSSNVTSIEIFSSAGEKIFQAHVLNNTFVDLSDKPAGVYFVAIKTTGDCFTRKIVKN